MLGLSKTNAPPTPPSLARRRAASGRRPRDPSPSPWRQRRTRTRTRWTPTRTGPHTAQKSQSKKHQSNLRSDESGHVFLRCAQTVLVLLQAQSGPGQRPRHPGQGNPRCRRGRRLAKLRHGNNHLTQLAAQHTGLHHLCQGGGWSPNHQHTHHSH